MSLGAVRGDLYPNCRTSRSEPHLVSSSTSMNNFMSGTSNSSSNVPRTPITPQQAMMNYARMSYRYTTVTLLSLRPQPELTIFPEHLVERRFLDDENYIDLDRMLVEKAGKFRLESYGILDGAGDGPIVPRRIHKYDFSDPIVIEKVKNRRPKDPMTPHQVAALTSVVTRHQPSALPTPLLASHPNSHPHVWIDDYSHRQTQIQRPSYRHSLPPQPSLPYQRKNPNQCETFVHQTKTVLSNHHSNIDKNNQTAPILQRLFQAQQRQQIDQRKIDLELNQSPKLHEDRAGVHYQGLSTFETPVTPAQSSSGNAFAWPFSTNQKAVTHPLHLALSTQTTIKQNQNILAHLINDQARCSTTIQTPATPGADLYSASESQCLKPVDDDDDDDEQDFYSAPPSPTQISDDCSNILDRKDKCDKSNIYDQASLLNSFIRNMVQEHQQRENQMRNDYTENDVHKTVSNQSLLSNESDSSNRPLQSADSYTEMYNLIRLLSPGIKSAAQQELLQYLEQGCAIEREELIRLIGLMNYEEQNKLKPIIARLINEQLDVLKSQQDIQQAHSKSSINRSGFHSSEIRSPLESWFGSNIYQSSYPRMPSAGVFSVGDLEESRLL